MRKRFEVSPILGSLPISEVVIPTKSRDELAPIILRNKKQTGRQGMSIWEVIVLSVIRLTLNTNYDRLLWIANFDKCVRQLMGIEGDSYGFSSEVKQYSLTALKENIGLLKTESITKINALVLEVGQGYLKTKSFV